MFHMITAQVTLLDHHYTRLMLAIKSLLVGSCLVLLTASVWRAVKPTPSWYNGTLTGQDYTNTCSRIRQCADDECLCSGMMAVVL